MSVYSKSLWNSRPKLGIFCILLLYVYFIVRVNRREDGIYQSRNESHYEEDVEDALEAIKYMKDLARGTAEIAPVIAQPQSLVEYDRCGKPEISRISEAGWVENDDFQIFSAYYDRRPQSLYPAQHIVQVLGMHYRTFNQSLYCTLQSPYTTTVVQATVREIWQRAWDPRDHFYVPYLISCPLPRRLKEERDLLVTVSTERCLTAATVALKVHYNENQAPEGKIAVCVKGLDFLENDGYARRFVEWMEAQLMLGADTVTVYTYALSEKMLRVLAHYETRAELENIRLTLPGESPNVEHVRSSFIWRNRQQKRRHELIPYNDCLYRHINTHEFILIVDTDEVVVPMKYASWSEMLKAELPQKLLDRATSISVSNVFKFPSSNETDDADLYMLRNRRRSAKIQDKKDYGKSFIKTRNVATVFNHFALHRQHGDVSRTIYIDPEVAVKLHYKEKCPIESGRDCDDLIKNTVEDESLDRWAGELRRRVIKVVDSLNL